MSANEVAILAEESGSQMPWILFQVAGQKCALSVENVISLYQMEEPVTKVAEYPSYFRGISIFRGEVVPMLELRSCMGFKSRESEYNEFVGMIDTRKADHERWVETLIDCMKEGKPFDLATDPRACAFGKWYYSYESEFETIKHHLAKMEEPHELLHQSALKAFACPLFPEAERRSCLDEAIGKAKNEYMPELLQLLDEAKEIMRQNYHEMSITLSDGKHTLGIIVDEVSQVDMLERVVVEGDLGGLPRSRLVMGIGHSKLDAGEILMLNEAELFAYISEQQTENE